MSQLALTHPLILKEKKRKEKKSIFKRKEKKRNQYSKEKKRKEKEKEIMT